MSAGWLLKLVFYSRYTRLYWKCTLHKQAFKQHVILSKTCKIAGEISKEKILAIQCHKWAKIYIV